MIEPHNIEKRVLRLNYLWRFSPSKIWERLSLKWLNWECWWKRQNKLTSLWGSKQPLKKKEATFCMISLIPSGWEFNASSVILHSKIVFFFFWHFNINVHRSGKVLPTHCLSCCLHYAGSAERVGFHPSFWCVIQPSEFIPGLINHIAWTEFINLYMLLPKCIKWTVTQCCPFCRHNPGCFPFVDQLSCLFLHGQTLSKWSPKFNVRFIPQNE